MKKIQYNDKILFQNQVHSVLHVKIEAEWDWTVHGGI